MDLLLVVLAVVFILYGIGLLISPAKGSFIAAVVCIGCGVIAYDSHSFLSLFVGFGLLWVMRLSGVEGQVDTRQTTDESISFLISLPPDQKKAAIDGILKFLESVNRGEVKESEAFPLLQKMKQKRMVDAKLTGNRDMQFASYQLIEDAYLTLMSHHKLTSGTYSAKEFIKFLKNHATGDQFPEVQIQISVSRFREFM